ncbi:hypothetical protein pb186bvf_017355 [Paramecium bursaria]
MIIQILQNSPLFLLERNNNNFFTSILMSSCLSGLIFTFRCIHEGVMIKKISARFLHLEKLNDDSRASQNHYEWRGTNEKNSLQ